MIRSFFALLLVSCLSAGLYRSAQAQMPFLEWSQEHADLLSLAILEDGEMVVEHQAQDHRPTAEGAFFLLAVEFARLAGEDLLDPELLVPLEEIERFSLPRLDGGAFEAWKQGTKGADGEEPEHVPLWMVVQGMVDFQSAAHADYVMRLLGRERCTSIAADLGLQQHGHLYPFQGARLAFLGLTTAPHKKAAQLRDMPIGAYEDMAWAWSDSLATDYEGHWSNRVKSLDFSIRRVWSSRLPYGTMEGYAPFAERVRTREGFSEQQTDWLERVLETSINGVEGSAAAQRGNEEFIGSVQRYAGASGQTDYAYQYCRYLITEDGRNLAIAINLALPLPEMTRDISPMLDAFEQQLVQDAEHLGLWSAMYAVDGE